MESQRKKWTQKEIVSEADLLFREKRKWQVALRRYVLEKKASVFYAGYFGLTIEDFRIWVEAQFSEDLNWDNFGKLWQLDHLLPLAYFDFKSNDELLLCWNFINIRVKKIDKINNTASGLEILSLQVYFRRLYVSTGLDVCRKMLIKIETLSKKEIGTEPQLLAFLEKNKDKIEKSGKLLPQDFNRLNKGEDLNHILKEQELLRKFG
jgi:hypothetical protein